ncbi:hypothetical protein J6590_072282 [Homalodisca vitripennis]|nr:hypothetical protein J6590_072282 [Homalodisca vitripennis]
MQRKGVKFVLGPEQQKAFESLKRGLVSGPVLKTPDFSEPFILHTDASGSAVGAHIKGMENVVAECLSRLFENTKKTNVNEDKGVTSSCTTEGSLVSDGQKDVTMTLFAIPEAFKDISQHQKEDPELAKIIKTTVKYQNYSVEQGVLLYKPPGKTKPRVVLPQRLIDLILGTIMRDQLLLI